MSERLRLHPSQKQRTRIAAGVSAAAIGALVLVGCTSAPPEPTGPVTLSVWADGARAPALEKYDAPDVTLEVQTIATPATDNLEKLQLANQAGSGWPDMFQFQIHQINAFNSSRFDNFLADLTPYLPEGLIDQFSPTAMAPCLVDGKVICLPNEVGPSVFWYNKPLMEEFGYEVPSTWEEYQALGLDVVQNHPGYIVGTVSYFDEAYLMPAGCPIQQQVDETTIFSNLTDPNCVRAAELVDPLLAGGAIAKESVFSPDFYAKYGGEANKWLMIPGAIWYGPYIFQASMGVGEGVLGMAPPITWAGESAPLVGNDGGVYYGISSHSEHPAEAAALAVWMASEDPQYDPANPTIPAFYPAQEAWIKTNQEGGYITASNGDLAATLSEYVEHIVTDYTFLPIAGIDANSVVVPAVANGATLVDTLKVWQGTFDNEVQAAGYKVIHSK